MTVTFEIAAARKGGSIHAHGTPDQPSPDELPEDLPPEQLLAMAKQLAAIAVDRL
jgi:hypothetical protein